jgi:spermidine/putrescine-binding protein
MHANRKLQSTLWFTALALTAAILLAACGGQATPATEVAPAQDSPPETSEPLPTSSELIVLDWSGYDLPEFRAPFNEKHPDLSPSYNYFADDAEAFAKAEGGFQFDVVHPCTNFWQLYVEHGLVQPIDTSRLSNWKNVYPALATQGEFNGKQYFVPYDWGYDSIIVRTDKVKDVPDSWADLWDSQYAGHLALFDSGEVAHVMTALAMGIDPWNTTAEQNEQITQKLLEIKPNVLNFWSDYSEVTQAMAAGDIWVAANVWNEAYTTLLDQDIPVEYIKPKEGRLGWLCGLGISSTAKNVDLAYDYIDAFLDPNSMVNMIDAYAYGGSNPEAVKIADQEQVALLEIGDPSILDSTVFYQGIDDKLRELVTSRWVNIKAAP